MNEVAKELLRKIESHTALVGIIGLGYVGLPLALCFTENGFRVLGFDVDPTKIQKLKNGVSYIKHLDQNRINSSVKNGSFDATVDFDRLSECDAILICVPTPLGSHKEPDLSYVENSARQIRKTLRTGQLIILESTTYPGTTDELLRDILESKIQNSNDEFQVDETKEDCDGIHHSTFIIHSLKNPSLGDDYFLAFSPEREDPGNPKFGTQNIPKVVGGVDEVSGDLAEALYAEVLDSTVRVRNARTAEASKLVENIFRSVNIALVNELKMIFEKMDIDVWDVLDAAETKPFGFMRFNPGPGLGGHCILGSEWVRVRGCGISGVYRAENLFKLIGRKSPGVVTANGIFVEPDGLEALALDVQTGDIGWFPVSTLYRGRYEGPGKQITTSDKRRVIVTSEHPMLVIGSTGVGTVAADAVKPGDELPLVSDLGDPCDNPVVDLVDAVPESERQRVWVRAKNHEWAEFEPELKEEFGWTIRDSIRKNSLRLDRFLQIEQRLCIAREDVVLMTGRGAARRDWPSTLEISPEFARLVGYYLAEGCITVERNASRVRLTFNRDELEYIDDVRNILVGAGFPTSVYNDATWHSTTIKASSLLLVWLFDEVWRCGRRSEEMRVPDVFFRLSPDHKYQLVSGLLRGDGDVWTRTGRSTYRKNGKTYCHHNATAQVGYFSSSQVLLEQVIHLLQDLGFQPGFKTWKHQIRIAGAETIERLIPFFDGAKRTRLETLQANRRRKVTSRSDLPSLAPGLRSTTVENVDHASIDGWVYSMEVETAGAFTTSSGIGVHNCIPLDPFYLAWKARESGQPTRFIELAGEINTQMPAYVIEKLTQALNERGKSVKGSKILVLGLAYKPDIDDPRESPSFEIIELLLERGAEVSYHDPHIPVAPRMRSWPKLPEMRSVELTPENLKNYHSAIIVTDHAAVDYKLVHESLQLIIDTRRAIPNGGPNVAPA